MEPDRVAPRLRWRGARARLARSPAPAAAALRAALDEAGTGAGEIEGVAYTAGPGLVGALLTGAALARSLGFGWGVPAIGVHHLEGHLLAPLLEQPAPPLPHVALLVSGGHTMLIEVHAVGEYRVLGQTRDDAAGEAFDKTAKLLGLPYPGGPQLAQLALQRAPGPLRLSATDARSAGLRVQLLGAQDGGAAGGSRHAADTQQTRADVAYAVQEAIVETLCVKALRALEFTGLRALVVAGGVGANRELRARLSREAAALGAQVYLPAPGILHRQCGDDRGRGTAAAALRRARGARDRGARTLAARGAAGAGSPARGGVAWLPQPPPAPLESRDGACR